MTQVTLPRKLLSTPSVKFGISIRAKGLLSSIIFIAAIVAGVGSAHANKNIPTVWLLRNLPGGYMKLEMKDMPTCFLHLLSLMDGKELITLTFREGSLDRERHTAVTFRERDFAIDFAKKLSSASTINGICIRTSIY